MPSHFETYGKETLTKRYTGVNDSTGQAISFADPAIKDFKCILIHVEGSTVIGSISGSLTHSEAAAAILTSDGFDIVLPVGNVPGVAVFTYISPSGTTRNVSCIAVR